MKLVATGNFKPEDVHRAVRPGEAIDVRPELGRKLQQQGLAAPHKKAREMAVRAARENALAFKK